jgi:hypothetical protein
LVQEKDEVTAWSTTDVKMSPEAWKGRGRGGGESAAERTAGGYANFGALEAEATEKARPKSDGKAKAKAKAKAKGQAKAKAKAKAASEAKDKSHEDSEQKAKPQTIARLQAPTSFLDGAEGKPGASATSSASRRGEDGMRVLHAKAMELVRGLASCEVEDLLDIVGRSSPSIRRGDTGKRKAGAKAENTGGQAEGMWSDKDDVAPADKRRKLPSKDKTAPVRKKPSAQGKGKARRQKKGGAGGVKRKNAKAGGRGGKKRMSPFLGRIPGAGLRKMYDIASEVYEFDVKKYLTRNTLRLEAGARHATEF